VKQLLESGMAFDYAIVVNPVSSGAVFEHYLQDIGVMQI
jgi:hypothetical protein